MKILKRVLKLILTSDKVRLVIAALEMNTADSLHEIIEDFGFDSKFSMFVHKQNGEDLVILPEQYMKLPNHVKSNYREETWIRLGNIWMRNID